MLSDRAIREQLRFGDLKIDPHPADSAFQPASVDLLLSGDFLSPYSDDHHHVDGHYYPIQPGECMLGSTVERITVPDFLVARVEGKSSFGRRFLMVHSTAGFIDPGFQGTITLELHNLSKKPIALRIGEPIAQVSFEFLDQPAERPYGHEGLHSRYQGQTGATAARN